MKRHLIAAAVSLCTATTSTLTGCAGADRSGPETAKPSPSLWSPIRKCRTPIKLCDQFEAQNPGIHLKFVTLPENEARAKITMSTATGGREFDIVMISNYETRQ